jgi:hypothetical protein
LDWKEEEEEEEEERSRFKGADTKDWREPVEEEGEIGSRHRSGPRFRQVNKEIDRPKPLTLTKQRVD